MHFHSDIRGIISSFLTIEDIPSLRVCKGINALQSTLIPQQAALFGWTKTKGNPLEFIKKIFEAVRSIDYYSFCQKDYINRNGRKIYVLKLYRTLLHLKNISFQNCSKALVELDPNKFPKHRLLLEVMGLSALTGVESAPQENKDRALIYASRYLAAPLCTTLLKQGADPNYLSPRSPFHEVILRGHLDLARVFITFQASLSLTATDYQSPLQYAVDAGVEMIDLLLASGAKDDPTPSGTAFSKALFLKRIEVAKRLKDQAQLLCRDSNHNSYLHLAMQNPEEDWMLEDYNPKTYINDLNFSSMTPLHTAVHVNNAQGVRYLVEHGASPNIRGILGKTPLELASDNIRPLLESPVKRRRTHARR